VFLVNDNCLVFRIKLLPLSSGIIQCHVSDDRNLNGT